jgi:hypothetical protein
MAGKSPKFKQSSAKISELQLDPSNPRLPERFSKSSQESLIDYIAEEYDSISIARSIALHGYFLSEPVIALEKEKIVVEGNRRLAALKILKDKKLRDKLNLTEKDEWEDLSKRITDLGDDIPVVFVPDRKSVAPIVGYRHISGIQQWDSWAKARFVANLLKSEGFDKVAEETGENENAIRASYRNYLVVKRAKEEGLEAERIEKSFGVFTRALTSEPLRSYLGLAAPSEVKKSEKVIPKEKIGPLRDLIAWLFGTSTADPVITESRDITQLGKAVGSPDGLKVLKETGDLEQAYIAAGGLRDRLVKRLSRAEAEMVEAQIDVPAYKEDEEVVSLFEKCQDALKALKELFHK